VADAEREVMIGGFHRPQFAQSRVLFEESFTQGSSRDRPEWGASVAAVVDGETVLNLWGGWIDAERSKPWSEDSVTGIFSCRKALTALSIHMAVDRNLLDYDDPVAKWWPEFASVGKEGVTIRHVLTHRSGLPALGLSEVPESFADVKSAIEALTPAWTPGTDIGYSATFDPILQVVLEQLFEEPLDHWFRREVATPCRADVFLVATEQDRTRVASWISADGAEWGVQDWWPENAYANGLGLARIFGSLVDSTHNDLLLTHAALERALVVQATGLDRISGHQRALRLGWRKPVGQGDVQIGSDGFGSPGGFGSVVWADPEHRLGFGYVRTLCVAPQDQYRADELLSAVIEALH
jgi:CubicO group peptidase (beta-lactamase class C family)